MVDTSVQVSRIEGVWKRFGEPPLIVERNSNDAIIDALLMRDVFVLPFTTTQASKNKIIGQLEKAFDYSEIRILNNDILVGELQAFEVVSRSANGMLKYSAPEGMHDDCVMALAIAWNGASRTSPAFL